MSKKSVLDSIEVFSTETVSLRLQKEFLLKKRSVLDSKRGFSTKNGLEQSWSFEFSYFDLKLKKKTS